MDKKTKISNNSLLSKIKRDKSLLLMLVPGVILTLVFSYGPMYGLIIAFKEYNIGLGIMDSPWVGFKHFIKFFSSPVTLNVLWNTISISFLRLIFGFPAPILLAIMLNEIRQGPFKKIVQTVSYFPHFISWIIVAGVVTSLLSPGTGVVNYIIKMFGGDPIFFLTDPSWFRVVIIVSGIWKSVGWESVIYLAALCSVPPELHEAATIDGASRLQRVRFITIPTIRSVISIMLLLSMGNIMNAGFDQIFNLYSPVVYQVSDIIDTYVYRMGIGQMMYSFNTAVGLFKSIVGVVLMVTVNFINKRFSDDGSIIF